MGVVTPAQCCGKLRHLHGRGTDVLQDSSLQPASSNRRVDRLGAAPRLVEPDTDAVLSDRRVAPVLQLLLFTSWHNHQLPHFLLPIQC